MVASATRSLASWSALEHCVGAMGTELPLLDRCGYGPSVPSPLTIYLRNHEAAARAGCDLFRRTAANQRHKPYADELRQVVTEVEEDLNSLRELMRRAGFVLTCCWVRRFGSPSGSVGSSPTAACSAGHR
jgi:hypothetical protein